MLESSEGGLFCKYTTRASPIGGGPRPWPFALRLAVKCAARTNTHALKSQPECWNSLAPLALDDRQQHSHQALALTSALSSQKL